MLIHADSSDVEGELASVHCAPMSSMVASKIDRESDLRCAVMCQVYRMERKRDRENEDCHLLVTLYSLALLDTPQ
jgi:hypothetical protein